MPASLLLVLPFTRMPAGSELTPFLIVVCFTAGLNVYATVALLGLFSHVGILSLPPGLHPVENWYVVGVCAILFLVEFLGDKIPVFDILWNAMHTFVRIPVAGLITYAATPQLPEWERLTATALGATIALASHGGKTAARAAVAHSPEPFSNIGLSLGEDAMVALLLWYVGRHPYATAGVVAVALIGIAIMARLVVRAMRNLFLETESALAKDSDTVH
jgi:hypothetical protein